MKIFKKEVDKVERVVKKQIAKALDEDPVLTLTETEINSLKEFLNGEAEIEVVEDSETRLSAEEVAAFRALLPKLEALVAELEEDAEEDIEEDIEEDLGENMEDVLSEEELGENIEEDEFLDEEGDEEKAEDASTKDPDQGTGNSDKTPEPEEEKAEDEKPKKRVFVKKASGKKIGDQVYKNKKPNSDLLRPSPVKASDREVTRTRKFDFHNRG